MRSRSKQKFAIFSFQFLIFNAVFLLSLFVNAQSPAPTPPQDVDVIRTETDLTNLLFTVTDKNKRYITTLQQNDIKVLEDGVPQTLFTFQRETERPLSIAFLIDVSISEERTLPDEKAAARTFIEKVIRHQRDEAAVIAFEGYAHLEQSLTHDVSVIYAALEKVEIANPKYKGSAPPMRIALGIKGSPRPREGSTAMWDAIAITCRDLMASSSASSRRVIILLTDGADTSSLLTRNLAIDEATKSGTVIYAIGIGDNRYEGVQKTALEKISEDTGGRAFFPKKNGLDTVFNEIAAEFRSQYEIAYRSPNSQSSSPFRKLTIEVGPALHKQGLKLRYPRRRFVRVSSRQH